MNFSSSFLTLLLFGAWFGATMPPLFTQHPSIGTITTVEKQYGDSHLDGYNLYFPPAYEEKGPEFPLIVFFQGGLGVGGEVDAIFQWELPKDLKSATEIKTELDELKLNTFVYLLPHISEGQFYQNTEEIQQLIEAVLAEYQLDASRVYLTGLSRGGHGSWGVASRIPDQFAAVAPICGSDHGIETVEGLTTLPIWTAHNVADGMVDYDRTKEVVARIEASCGESFHRTSTIAEANVAQHDRIFTSGSNPEFEHNAWTEMYNEVKFYQWLLRFQSE
ncbi:MAG: PHB depolymerase family esterase [Bacteroidota bacterium]